MSPSMMSHEGKTAYITGGASGIGRAIAEMLVAQGVKVYIADLNLSGAESFVTELNARSSGSQAAALEVDASSWESQKTAFVRAVGYAKRIDYVFPIAGVGEKQFVPNHPSAEDFIAPNLMALNLDLTGVLYTISLALQQFRRQEKDEQGFRGKIGCVASVCGFYCVPTLPVYTAAKHGLTGFVRSYGKYLPEEGITLNAVAPNVVRTAISTGDFYDLLEREGLLTPMDGVIKAMISFLSSDMSGEILEVGPQGGYSTRAPSEYLDEASRKVCELLEKRGRPLHTPA